MNLGASRRSPSSLTVSAKHVGRYDRRMKAIGAKRPGEFEGAKPLHQAPSGAAAQRQGVETGICTKKGHRRKSMTIFVEIVGLEPNLHPLADTLVLMLSIAYFCRRSCSTMSEIGILLGYYHGSRGV